MTTTAKHTDFLNTIIKQHQAGRWQVEIEGVPVGGSLTFDDAIQVRYWIRAGGLRDISRDGAATSEFTFDEVPNDMTVKARRAIVSNSNGISEYGPVVDFSSAAVVTDWLNDADLGAWLKDETGPV